MNPVFFIIVWSLLWASQINLAIEFFVPIIGPFFTVVFAVFVMLFAIRYAIIIAEKLEK